jgi:hypothetical protein
LKFSNENVAAKQGLAVMKTKPAPVSSEKKTKPRVVRPRPAAKLPSQEPIALVETPKLKARRAVKPKLVKPVKPVKPAAVRRRKIEVPSLLLEGDQPALPPASGPGQKYALGPVPPSQHFENAETELPEAYGTGRLFLTARDPHWLYAHWDLTREQQSKLNAKSSDGHLILRLYAGKIEGHPVCDIHVHPESRHWFAHVERSGDSYAAELGYYSPLGRWTRIAVSSATVTPPDAAAVEGDVEFATIPFEFPFAKLIEIIKSAVRENLPLAQAVEELRRHGHPDLPRANGTPVATWTAQQEQALAKIINIDEGRRVWMGSLEITELIRRRLTQEISSLGVSSLSSPFGGGLAQPKGFWFNVNAELIIYGATEPTARVTLGGHEIKLRSDGSFSFRFALPDGKYDLPAVAVSADGTDARAANLKFGRQTEYLGDVGAHPQDPALKPPLPGNV